MKWTCKGDVRGECGINHRTHAAAQAHCARDQAAVSRNNSSGALTRAYSDRRPEPVDAAAQAEADAADVDAAAQAGGY